jgi:hypothetical protein
MLPRGGREGAEWEASAGEALKPSASVPAPPLPVLCLHAHDFHFREAIAVRAAAVAHVVSVMVSTVRRERK